MSTYNDIFTLSIKGFNHSQIKKEIGTVIRKTIISAMQLAEKYNFHYKPEDSISDVDIHHILHPKKDRVTRSDYI